MSTKDENEQISDIVSTDENNYLVCQQRGEVGTELKNGCQKQENQQDTSSENQNLAYFPDQPIGTRLRKPTEKGKAYELEILSQKRQTCYRNLSSLIQKTYEILDAEKQTSTLETLEDIRDVLDKSKSIMHKIICMNRLKMSRKGASHIIGLTFETENLWNVD
jgi:hypothetical protein